MKKRFELVSVLLLVITLTACTQQIEFEPVTVDGFEVSVEMDILIDQGKHELDDEELAELLPELFIELETDEDEENGDDEEEIEVIEPVLNTEAPDIDFTFLLELVDYELTHEVVQEAEDFVLPTESAELVTNNESATFDEIEFTDAGVFTYQVIQLVMTNDIDDELVENPSEWQYDESVFEIIVTITKDAETESLVATVKSEDITFVNEYIFNIEEEITEALAELERLEEEAWEARVAEAREEGYELTRDAEGNETRTAIYVPEPASVAAVQNLPAGNSWDGNNNGNGVNTYTPPPNQSETGGNHNTTNNNTASAPPQAPEPAPEPTSPPAQNCSWELVWTEELSGVGEGTTGGASTSSFEYVCH